MPEGELRPEPKVEGAPTPDQQELQAALDEALAMETEASSTAVAPEALLSTPEILAAAPEVPQAEPVLPDTQEVQPIVMPESEPVVTEAKTLLEQEQDLDKLRHDYFSAKGVKRAVFKRQESLSDDAIRRLGKSYETLKNEVVSRKLKIKIDELTAAGEFQGKRPDDVNTRMLNLVDSVFQDELTKENAVIQGQGKGKWQKIKESYNRINPIKKFTYSII